MNKPTSRKRSGTDWERLSTMRDSDIDLSESAELGASFFANAALVLPEPKEPISLRIDKEVVDWFRKQGSGYQTRMNAVLRMYMRARVGRGARVPATRVSRAKTPRQRVSP